MGRGDPMTAQTLLEELEQMTDAAQIAIDAKAVEAQTAAATEGFNDIELNRVFDFGVARVRDSLRLMQSETRALTRLFPDGGAA